MKNVLDMSGDSCISLAGQDCGQPDVSPSCYVPGDPNEPIEDMLERAEKGGCVASARSGEACLRWISGAMNARSRVVALWLYSKAVNAASTTQTDTPAIYDRLMDRLKGVYERIDYKFPRVDNKMSRRDRVMANDAEIAASMARDLVNRKSCPGGNQEDERPFVTDLVSSELEDDNLDIDWEGLIDKEKAVSWVKRAGSIGVAIGIAYCVLRLASD